MNILFLTLMEITDINERGIYHDLLRRFKCEGHKVYVIYPLERRKKLHTNVKEQDGVTLLGVRCLNIQKTNIVEKGIGTILLETQFLKEVKKRFSKINFDLILYSTPPITLTKVIKYIKQKNKAISYLLLKDIFPQNAVDLGIIRKGGFLHKFFIKKEKELYQYSDYIGCMSPANVKYVINHNPELRQNAIEVNPNTISVVHNKLNPHENSITRRKYHIPDNVLVLIYGGNLGKPQGIDFLIEVLDVNLIKNDVFFVIVGSGTEFKKIRNWFEEKKPLNAILINSLPKSEYDQLLDAADIGLIFLDKRFTIPNFPSRLLSYLEKSMPVLLATDNNTDIGEIIVNAKCGFWCESGDLKTFNKFINRLINERELIKEMGENSNKLLRENYTVEISYNLIIDRVRQKK
ncbi:MAG: glycosyltransferase family 4 protein [Ginsengibacter sp.]